MTIAITHGAVTRRLVLLGGSLFLVAYFMHCRSHGIHAGRRIMPLLRLGSEAQGFVYVVGSVVHCEEAKAVSRYGPRGPDIFGRSSAMGAAGRNPNRKGQSGTGAGAWNRGPQGTSVPGLWVGWDHEACADVVCVGE